VLQSYMYFGALLLIGLLMRSRELPASASPV